MESILSTNLRQKGNTDLLGFRWISTDYFVFEMWLLMGFALKRYGGTVNDANFRELNRKFSF